MNTRHVLSKASEFVPRTAFPAGESIPRSYFLGHHRVGLSKMKTMLSSIDLVIECRDYRLPITSRNPLFEESLAGRQRLIVYTKKDLGSNGLALDRSRENDIRRWHAPVEVLFSDHKDQRDIRRIMKAAQHQALSPTSLTGSRMMVVGMPNVGKSSLLNALRQQGIGKGKVAQTGGQPGVTRKIGTCVRISHSVDGGPGLYMVDTPGVFIPYVPDAQAMLKLALCGSVKDTIIPPTILADFLLYHLNLCDPSTYRDYHPPTNEIISLLDAVARKTGRLQKGGVPDLEAAALWLIQRWRGGDLGHFLLDDVAEEAFLKSQADSRKMGISLNQAKKAARQDRKSRRAAPVLEVG